MIGQNTKLDAIIFVNGDTIYGNIIEVGTEEITYTYKGESIKNKTRTSALAKIDFANGRGQNFKGLDALNRRISKTENLARTRTNKILRSIKDSLKNPELHKLRERQLKLIISGNITGYELGIRITKLENRILYYSELRYGSEYTYALYTSYDNKRTFYPALNIGVGYIINNNFITSIGIDFFNNRKVTKDPKYHIKNENNPITFSTSYLNKKYCYTIIYRFRGEQQRAAIGIGRIF